MPDEESPVPDDVLKSAKDQLDEEEITLADNEEVRELDGTLRQIRPISLPDGDVEVVERSRPDGDRLEKTITLRWRVPGEE